MRPELKALAEGHLSACHFAESLSSMSTTDLATAASSSAGEGDVDITEVFEP